MKKLIILLIAVLGMGLFVGCGGAGSGGSSEVSEDSNNITQVSSEKTLIATGTSSSTTQIKGSDGFYYNTCGCRTNGLAYVQYSFYDDGLVNAEYQWQGSTYPSVCYVTSAYKHIKLNTITDVDGAYVNPSTFYDNNTKIYYSIASSSENSSDRLIEVINDGNNAVIKRSDGSTYQLQIREAFTVVALSSIGITKYNPSADYYTGRADDIMETGYKSSFGTSDKPYDFIGYLYNYAHSGCQGDGLHITYYEIHNDGLMKTLRDDGTTSSCTITAFYEHINRNITDVDGAVDGAYVNQSTFYDNNTRIYYNMANSSENSSDRLIEVINDGNNAVIKRSDGSTYQLQISSVFRRIEK